MVQLKQPSLKKLTAKDYGRPPPKQSQVLQDLTKGHIESFNYVLREGLQKAVQNIPPVEFELPNGSRMSLYIRDATISPPTVNVGPKGAVTVKLYPAECRESSTTYGGQLQLSLMWDVDGKTFGPEHKNAGLLPIMVKSNLCNLHGLSPQELISRGEEAEEMGGYFVVNGNEKVIRMLTMPRRNYPTCLSRPGWTGRGKMYTEFGVTMRCVKDDLTASNIVLHYLNNGSANMCFTYRKEQFFVPIILIMKALGNVTDQHIFKELTKGKDDSFFKGCVANMLRLAQEEKLSKQDDICRYIGQRFRVKTNLPPWYTDRQITEYLLKECVCIHLNSNMDKFNLLVYMTRKLFAYAKGECAAESHDSPMFQEVLLGGHLYLMTLKEVLYDSLQYLRLNIEKLAKAKGAGFKIDTAMMMSALRRTGDVTKRLTNMLSSGNLVSSSGLGLMQYAGLAVVADKLNFMRFLSHFRAVHRGAFFAEMRTTAVRKLLPEAWGFLCPVHTPDGTPCGLLNHLAANCEVVNKTYTTKGLHHILIQLGMEPLSADLPFPSSEYYAVLLDGTVVGWIHQSLSRSMAEQLRVFKVTGKSQVPPVLEICLVERTEVASQYPGLYLFTGLARLVRPVKNLALNMTEYIGTFEQVYLNVCVIPEEAHPGKTTHMEISETGILSAAASLTPYSDFNQSPRNMYQCQMGKQTMGTPLHAFGHRADSKLYRIQTPQAPMVRPAVYDDYCIDNYPLGTNAIVAVISYTGYDMEDAMIINKSSCERGFGHGSIYKSYFINLKEMSKERGACPFIFGGVKPGDPEAKDLDKDGLPPVGKYLTEGCPFYSFVDIQTGVVKVMKYKDMEPAYVDQIKILGHENGNQPLTNICFILRQVRNPIIGDKFASRHGQKGICSQLWPTEDMPFSESGMTPDIIFNPHGFPSRMTIGMMIESMAGKSAAMHGIPHDATPFTFSEDSPPIDHFGNLLTKAGYDYYGTEKMYSGVDGREFEADIFIGVVYYQRLRHMVSDKFQVRTTGIVDKVTRQPMKGRKRAGGIRFGEMERDGLLSHGTPFLLKDRLLNCSDKSTAHVCTRCGSLLSTMCEPMQNWSFQGKWMCRSCDTKDTVKVVTVPHVFKYLVAELAAMNVKVSLNVQDIAT